MPLGERTRSRSMRCRAALPSEPWFTPCSSASTGRSRKTSGRSSPRSSRAGPISAPSTHRCSAALCGGVVATPLDRNRALSLAELSTAACLRELEFLLPVRGSGEALSAARLGEAFDRWARPPVPPSYAARVASLGFSPLLGYLRGFVDLVFVHEGRYFVVDYKTNHLGPSVGDYASERLVAAMSEHHYFLQYHLYTVALHRLLGRDFPATATTSISAACTTSSCGVSPRDHGAGHGVFFDRPSVELVSALEQALDGEGT